MPDTYAFTSQNGTRVEIPDDHLNGCGLDDIGYCLICGLDYDNVEPDARKYPCDECGKNSVYGAQEIMIAGLLT